MDKEKQRYLNEQAAKIRYYALNAVQSADSGHIGGSFSLAEILSVLYFDKMNIDAQNPKNPIRDRFVLSKGHCTPAVYGTLALRGFFPLEDLQTFRKINSYLSGHIEMKRIPGVDMSTGSLGQGMSVGAGMALSAKTDGLGFRVYVVTGDGELQEGQNWEAAMAAAHFKLDNLRVIVDNNHLQLDGAVEDIMSVSPIAGKFESFGWHTIAVNGHDVLGLKNAFDKADTIEGKPVCIVADTIKGKGVSLFENGVQWHGSRPNAEEYKEAYRQISEQLKRWEA